MSRKVDFGIRFHCLGRPHIAPGMRHNFHFNDIAADIERDCPRNSHAGVTGNDFKVGATRETRRLLFILRRSYDAGLVCLFHCCN
mmetsp:Transcript_83126/g.164938  ORF Transcript_83126/g.164938 Transcript_83126/m.164938 type:complete len:85 (-) Transcript_83126:935-1189(-)